MSEESSNEMAPTTTNDSEPPVDVLSQQISGTSLPFYLPIRSSKNDDLNTKDVQEDEQEQVNDSDSKFYCEETEDFNRSA